MGKILIIDSDVRASESLLLELQNEFEIDIILSHSYEKSVDIVKQDAENISLAIVDPCLTDDANTQIIDLLLENKIPIVVYASAIAVDLIDEIIYKPIVDYLLKSNRNNFPILFHLIGRILRSQKSAVLVVDDSKTTCMQLSLMLNSLDLHIFEAHGMEEALQKIKSHPEIKLVMTDYNMQEGKSGIDFTTELRKSYTNKEIAVIGNSAYGNPKLHAEFLKCGANAFINKPFEKEELINMVLFQLDMIDYIERLKNSSEKDFLTNIYSRKYIYEVGRKLFNNAKRGNISLACAMLDIDNFKTINDTYGHDVGDSVITRFAEELSSTFRDSDIVGRIGGDEFCVVLASPEQEEMHSLFERFRERIEELEILIEDKDKRTTSLSITVSIGITNKISDSFEDMLKYADLKLYEAKNRSRNVVVL